MIIKNEIVMESMSEESGYNLLGVLGGMGPAATINFLTTLLAETRSNNDQDNIPTLTYNNCRIPDRNRAYLEGGLSPVPELIRSTKLIEDSGADLMVIPCCTAHIWYREISESSHIKVLNIVEVVLQKICGYGKIGIIGTTPVMKSGLFRKPLSENGVYTIEPQNQKEVMQGIYAVKAGKISEGEEIFSRISQSLVDKGAEVILEGCTEVSLAMKNKETEFHSVDPIKLLATKCVELFRGKK